MFIVTNRLSVKILCSVTRAFFLHFLDHAESNSVNTSLFRVDRSRIIRFFSHVKILGVYRIEAPATLSLRTISKTGLQFN